MDLSLLTLDVRPKPPWQALDLGLKLGVKHYFKMLLVWCSIAAPLFIVSGLALIKRPDLWVLFVWWCKPIMEHGMLVYLSRQIFQRPTHYRDILQSLFSAKSGLLGSLTYRRLSPRRSALMPVAVLEQQNLKKSITRRGQLARKLGSPAGWLTFVVMHVELFLMLGAMALAFMLIPEHHGDYAWNLLVESNNNALIAFNSLWILAMAAMAPIYSSGGFCLYLNARSSIEGWDLELHFRQISLAIKRATSVVLISMLTVPCLIASQTASAISPAEAHEALTTLQNKAPLGEEVTYRELVRTKQTKKAKARAPRWSHTLALGLEIIGWALAGTLMYVFARFIWEHRERIQAWMTHRVEKKALPITSWSTAVKPTDTQAQLAHAEQLLRDGSIRGAMSELVITTLFAISNKGVRVHIHSTSNELCLALTHLTQPWAKYATEVLNQWIQLAWAHDQETSSQTVQKWIEQWELHFSHNRPEDSRR